MSKPLKEDYIIRIKSRIEQRLDEPAAEEEKEEFVELMTRGSLVLKGGSYYVTYRETAATGYEGDWQMTVMGCTARFAYLLDADSAELVSSNRLEVTVTHVN